MMDPEESPEPTQHSSQRSSQHLQGDAELADILQHLCELEGNLGGDSTEFEKKLDRLSEEELGDLFGAGQCLHLLQRLRDHQDSQGHIALADTASKQNTMADAMAAANISIPEKIGRYEIIRLAAQGGFANIYQAYDPQLERDVALKVPLLQRLNHSDGKERFQREARAVAMLSHPAIVPVFEAGETDAHLYIALQWVPGINLHLFLKTAPRPIAPHDAAAAIERIADAVAHAHSKGILHRDIKPANLLLDENELAERPWFECLRITDFGLAKNFSESGLQEPITVDGSILGTPAYMSPEQVRSDADIGPAADVYSLGTVLYELLTENPPHRKATYSATIRAIEVESPTPIAKRVRGVPNDLIAICEKCLAKNSGDRYSSAFELAEDLARFRQGRPVNAKRPGTLNLLSHWIKRNPVVATCLAITFISLAGGLLATTTMWTNATESRDELQRQVGILKSIFEDLDHTRDGEVIAEPDLRDRLAERLISSADLIADSKDFEQRISLMATLGNTLATLGHPFEGEQIISQALEMTDGTLSKTQRLELEVRLANSMTLQNKFSEVSEQLGEILEEVMANSSIGDRTKADAIWLAAESRFQLREYEQAILDCRRMLELLPTWDLAAEHKRRLTAVSEFRIVNADYYQKPNRDSLEKLRIALEKFLTVYSIDHSFSISVSYSVVNALRSHHQFDEALEIAESTLASAQKKFGLNDRNTLTALDGVLVVCGSNHTDPKFRKRMLEVLPIAESTCETVIADLGDGHPDMITLYGNVSTAFGLAGDMEKCIAISRRLVELSELNLGRMNRVTQDQIFGLGVALRENGQNDEAIKWLNEYIEVADQETRENRKRVRVAHQQVLIAKAANLFKRAQETAQE